MPQIFRQSANTLARATLLGIVVLGVAGGATFLIISRSSYVTGVGMVRPQPVQFSHRHHVETLGIPCLVCHTSVEQSAFAGMPSTKTCMSCHSQVWSDSPMLKAVRESLLSGTPLAWERVHDLSDFAYFNHSIHVRKGIGCETCHGRVDQMALTYQAQPLTMTWCLDCHRSPERYVRPRDQVFTMGYAPPGDRLRLGRELVERYRIKRLTDCSVCHR